MITEKILLVLFLFIETHEYSTVLTKGLKLMAANLWFSLTTEGSKVNRFALNFQITRSHVALKNIIHNLYLYY